MEKTKKCLLNVVLQYLQPTEFCTPVTYGKNEKCIILLNCITSLPFFRLLTRLFCQRFLKIKNVDKIKNVKKRKNVTKIKKHKKRFYIYD